jgi:rod shape determining protein RodA
MNRSQAKLTAGIDWPIFGLYLALVAIGLMAIFAAEYREVHDPGYRHLVNG